MNLRPHHLLCIQKFTGHGYDAAFTAHMAALTAALRAAPQTQICLTAGTDDLCVCCPHRRSDCCEMQEKVTALDQAVLESCALQAEAVLDWDTLAAVSRTTILQTASFDNICGACQWFALCKKTEVTYGTNSKTTICTDT